MQEALDAQRDIESIIAHTVAALRHSETAIAALAKVRGRRRLACCMLSVHAAWGLLHVARYMLRGVCRMLHAAWYLLHAL